MSLMVFRTLLNRNITEITAVNPKAKIVNTDDACVSP